MKSETKQKIKQAILDQIHANWETPDYPSSESWIRKPLRHEGVILFPLGIGAIVVLIYCVIKLVQIFFF